MRFIVESGMPFNCVKLESFEHMLTLIIPPEVPGVPTPKPPTYHMIRTTFLDELDAEVQKCVKPVLATAATYGCTIMTDGWTNIRGQTLCNYLVGTTRGATYIATDVMRGKKDATALAQAWLRRLKSLDIKLADITAFVTNSVSSNVSAMKVFHKDESVKHIFWIPYVAHVMDLILEDIGGIEWVATRIAQARLVTKVFKRHSHAREVLQAFTMKTLLLPAETRFGTHMVESDTRQIDKILRRYDEMIVRCSSACAALEVDEQDALLEVFDRRRTMFKSPAHVAAMMLDPEFRDHTMPDDEEMQHVTKEELTPARERMRAVSRMGATCCLRECDTRRCRSGGRGGGRRGGRGRGGRGGPGGRCSVASRGRATDELVRKPRQRWDEGDFLYESSSSDDEDFFGTGRPAHDGDSDFDDYHPDVDDDDDAAAPVAMITNSAGALRPAHGDTMRDDGAGGEHRTTVDDARDGVDDDGSRPVPDSDLRRLKRGPRKRDTIVSSVRKRHGGVASISRAQVPATEQIPVFEDSFSDHSGEERIELHGGNGHPRGDTSSMHATAPMGPSAAVLESQQGPTPLMHHPEVQGEIGPLPVVRDEGSAGALHPLTSAGAAVSVAATSDVGQPLAAAEQENMLPPRSVQPRPPPALMEGSQGTVVVCLGDDLPKHEISHSPAAKQSAAGHVGLTCPTDHGLYARFSIGLVDVHIPSIAQRSLSHSFDGAEEGSPGGPVDAVESEARPPGPPSNSEHHPIVAAVGADAGVPVAHTFDATKQPVVGSSPTARHDRATVLPTVAFYASGKSTGGMDEQGVRNNGRPSAPSMGTRSIGSVDGARHTAMAEFEDRHGSTLPTKTSDVHATRVAKASLSRARKKASTRKASRSSSHMRSRERGSGVVHLEDGEIAPDGDALDVGGKDATTTDIAGREGTGDAVAG
ncbi:hypothetical protein CBR_g30007 [Chara braunii]|uniref:DUF659 domain-containing protein n=1 Tax=Chara braunii TaxID=69332 RepID=A0A388LC26_CHABU|nr:hypothetical protein CBR_g30007 [Chara braunii]|eukprot:GBG79743.1 hypothetical protein CBR_g30007 [Chara braunii]